MENLRSVPVTDEVRTLRYMRIESGFSLNRAGALIEISGAAISHIENGRMRMPFDRIEPLVTGYGYSMTDFFKLSRNGKVPPTKKEECHKILDTLPLSEMGEVLTFLRTKCKNR